MPNDDGEGYEDDGEWDAAKQTNCARDRYDLLNDHLKRLESHAAKYDLDPDTPEMWAIKDELTVLLPDAFPELYKREAA